MLTDSDSRVQRLNRSCLGTRSQTISFKNRHITVVFTRQFTDERRVTMIHQRAVPAITFYRSITGPTRNPNQLTDGNCRY